MPEPAPVSAGGGSARRAGFTLLEILVVIALVAMITTALIVGTSRLLQSRTPSAAEFFWKAVDAVRRDALLNDHDVRLSFDPKARQFVADSDAGEQVYAFAPVVPVDVNFLASGSDADSNSAILVAGQMVQTQTIPFVTFYGDGTCSPFRVQFSGKDSSSILEIDPWTCAPVLKAQPSP